MMTQTKNNPSILVIGAGPVGLTMAAELARHGASFRIIDKKKTTTDKSKALVVHARTMEIFEDMGIIAHALDAGTRVNGASIYAGEKRLLHLRMEHLSEQTRYPYFLDLNQEDTESMLEQQVESLGHSVQWQTEVTSLNPADDQVEVIVKHADGQETTETYDYVCGCDGAHSFARKALNLEFAGAPYPSRFILADTQIDWKHSPDEWYAYLTDQGLFFAAPLKDQDRWRIIAEVPWETQEQQDESYSSSGDRDPSLEEVQEVVDRLSPTPVTLHDPVWLSFFQVHHRLVERHRQGRIFLAGDAAHIHSPVGGQGMNTGIQDAYNLAWKLALVTQGKAQPSILDSYEEERHPVGQQLLEQTDKVFGAIIERNPVKRQVRDQLVHFLGGIGLATHQIEQQMSMLEVSYEDSSILEDHETEVREAHGIRDAVDRLKDWSVSRQGPKAGERAPDAPIHYQSEKHPFLDVIRSPNHRLVLFGGDASASRDFYSSSAFTELQYVAQEVGENYGPLVDIYWSVLRQQVPPAIEAEDCLLDTYGSLHEAYGIRSESLYLIRPDGYVGFRSHPVQADALLGYLSRFFVSQYAFAE